jgi:hypothetical protein
MLTKVNVIFRAVFEKAEHYSNIIPYTEQDSYKTV